MPQPVPIASWDSTWTLLVSAFVLFLASGKGRALLAGLLADICGGLKRFFERIQKSGF